MKKLVLLQFITLIAFAIGLMASPDKPIYPFFPQEFEYDLILYREMHIWVVVALWCSSISLISSILMNVSNQYSFFMALVPSVVFWWIESFRNGAVPQFDLSFSLAYLLAVLCPFGVYLLLSKVCGQSKN